MLAAGARFGRVLADAGYGMSAAFRRGLSERGLAWAVGIPKVQNVYSTTVELRRPKAGTGRPRKHPVPSEDPVRPRPCWRTPNGAGSRGGAGPRGRSRPSSPPRGCARPRARSSGTAGTCRARRCGSWASVAPPASGSTTSPTCRLDAPLEELAATIKARWVCEQAHQQLKEELGLDHFEGRSWTGLHRHALLAMIAFCFLQHLRLRERGEKRGRSRRAAAAADLARGPAPAARAVRASRSPLPVLRV